MKQKERETAKCKELSHSLKRTINFDFLWMSVKEIRQVILHFFISWSCDQAVQMLRPATSNKLGQEKGIIFPRRAGCFSSGTLEATLDQKLTGVFLGWQVCCKVNWNNAKWVGIPLVALLTKPKRKLSIYTFMPHPLKSSEHIGNQHLPVTAALHGSWQPHVGLMGCIIRFRENIIITAGLNKLNK